MSYDAVTTGQKKEKNESTSHKKNRNFISTHTLRKAEKKLKMNSLVIRMH